MDIVPNTTTCLFINPKIVHGDHNVISPYFCRAVLELVLQGCKGDVVKAIEHFLSAQDSSTLSAGSPRQEKQSNNVGKCHAYPYYHDCFLFSCSAVVHTI